MHGGEWREDLSHDKGDAVRTACVVDGNTLAEARVGAEDEGEIGELRGADGPLKDIDLDVLIQVRKAIAGDVCPILTYISLGAVEMRAEVGQLDWTRIMKCERLNPRQCEILGNLHSKAAQPNKEDRTLLHAAHSFMPKHVKLSTVQPFID